MTAAKRVCKTERNKMITIKFTQEELLQLHRALDNCWGDGDWLDHLHSKKEEKAFHSAWKKIEKNRQK